MTVLDPESFEERKESVLYTLQRLAQWPHCRHDKYDVDMDTANTETGRIYSFDRELESRQRRGLAPPVGTGYAWQVASSEFVHNAVWMDEDDVEDRLAELRHILETEAGIPNATDGSKGQWRADKYARIQLYEWLLYGDRDAE